MKKNQIIIVVVLAIVIVLVVAAFIIMPMIKKDEYANVNVASNEMVAKIVTDLGNEMSPMMEVTEADFKAIYDIDVAKLDSFCAQMPMMNVRVNEIVIVRVKDKADIEEVKNKLKTRTEAVAKTFEMYLADQYEIAKAPLITSKGNYVIMTMSDKKDDIEKIFNSYFTNK